MTEVPRIYNEKRIVSLYMVLGKLGIYMQKKSDDARPLPYIKLTQKGLKTQTNIPKREYKRKVS